MAGHSHWKQVKHHKGAADAKRGQVFSKLVKEITIAAREAGVNPDANPRLRAACERARDEGLPKENIKRALARAAGRGEGAELVEVRYEASAPGGVALLIECITDNKNRTVNEIKHLLDEHGGRLAEPGSLSWGFEKIGVMECAASADTASEASELAIIESGARDFTKTDDGWIIETDFAARENVRAALERAGFTIRAVYHDYNVQSPVVLTPNIAPRIESLIEALDDHDDVQEVYTNLRE